MASSSVLTRLENVLAAYNIFDCPILNMKLKQKRALPWNAHKLGLERPRHLRTAIFPKSNIGAFGVDIFLLNFSFCVKVNPFQITVLIKSPSISNMHALMGGNL